MKKPKKILIVRTDRLGDVVLSTPVIACVRSWAPDSWIAFMCRPYTRDVVSGHPMLNEIIVYDKYDKQRSWFETLRFARYLKQKEFDLALVLHATNRVHFLCRFAGIPKRVGWDRKSGFLLTDKVPYLKHEGTKHEMEYTFEVLHKAGIPVISRKPYIHVSDDMQFTMKKRILNYGYSRGFVAVHPGASSPSKKWPLERFSEVIDRIHAETRLPVIIVGGNEEKELGRDLSQKKESFVKDLTGSLSVKELAALLTESIVLLSNDSGPVHVAAAVGTPVVAIFGRKRAGLGYQMWAPCGEKDKALHKDAGCLECVAEDCERNFACLQSVTVEEVVNAVMTIVKDSGVV